MPALGVPSLKELSFFKGLPDTLLWHLGRAAQRRTLAKDEVLFSEGQPRQMLGVVVSGTLSIERQQGDTAVEIATLGAGEVVGEAILLEEPAHGASGRATEPTEIVLFKKDQLAKLLKDQPALYSALLSRAARVINERIKRANAAFLAGRAGSGAKK